MTRSSWPKRLGIVVFVGLGFLAWAWLDSSGISFVGSDRPAGSDATGRFPAGMQAWRAYLGKRSKPKGQLQRAAEAAVCPREYRRLTLNEVTKRQHRPYLFGGTQLPRCRNCDVDTTWSHFCKYESHGPVCNQWDIDNLVGYFVERAGAGAPGVAEMLTLTPCDLWPYLQNRTVWLVGDSITQEFMKAMQCFFMEFWDLETRPISEDGQIVEALGVDNTPWCIELPEDSRICHLRCNMGTSTAEKLIPALARYAKRTDIWVENFAVWINSWEEYAENMRLFGEAYRAYKEHLPFLVWRDSSVQHFSTPTGTFVEGAWPCKPINITLNADNSLSTEDEGSTPVVAGDWRNIIADPVIAELGVPNLRTWNMSVPLWEYHHNYNPSNDCTHTCHPSAYQMWIWHLYRALEDSKDRLWAHMDRLPTDPPADATR